MSVCLKRYDSPSILTRIALQVSLSTIALVTVGSPKTSNQRSKDRLVVTIVDFPAALSDKLLNNKPVPSRSKAQRCLSSIDLTSFLTLEQLMSYFFLFTRCSQMSIFFICCLDRPVNRRSSLIFRHFSISDSISAVTLSCRTILRKRPGYFFDVYSPVSTMISSETMFCNTPYTNNRKRTVS